MSDVRPWTAEKRDECEVRVNVDLDSKPFFTGPSPDRTVDDSFKVAEVVSSVTARDNDLKV